MLGWLSVAVPGEVAGQWAAYKNFGSYKKPNQKVFWKDLVQPTVDLLATGLPHLFLSSHPTFFRLSCQSRSPGSVRRKSRLFMERTHDEMGF